MLQLDHVSIWELAHRWHGYDPSTSNPQEIPLEVQDTLRLITKAQYYHRIGISTSTGIELKNDRTLVRREDYSFQDHGKNLSEYDQDEIYTNHAISHSKRHNELVQELTHCFLDRSFDRSHLESIHITKPWALLFCLENTLPLPDFWISKDEVPELKKSWTFKLLDIETDDLSAAETSDIDQKIDSIEEPTRMAQENIDSFWNSLENKQRVRLLCREAAKALWSKDPSLTIADISKHEFLLQLGAKHYSGRDTVRNWIRNLDPRSDADKRGRPAKLN